MNPPLVDAPACPEEEVDPKDLAKHKKRADFSGVTTRDGKTYITLKRKDK